METLDNAVWHALHGPHRHFGEHHGRASRYLESVNIFCALPDEPTPDDWVATAALVGAEGQAVIFRAEVDVPNGWQQTMRFDGWQLVGAGAQANPAPAEARVAVLGPDDVADMLALVARTDPGPFLERTIELGRHLGIRTESSDGSRLIAMAAERIRLDGYTEISAVCTDAAFRGRGLASVLVRDLVHDIRSRDEVPFLHAMSDEAVRLYESLGFTRRRRLQGVVVSPTSVG